MRVRPPYREKDNEEEKALISSPAKFHVRLFSSFSANTHCRSVTSVAYHPPLFGRSPVGTEENASGPPPYYYLFICFPFLTHWVPAYRDKYKPFVTISHSSFSASQSIRSLSGKHLFLCHSFPLWHGLSWKLYAFNHQPQRAKERRLGQCICVTWPGFKFSMSTQAANGMLSRTWPKSFVK
jgi:hypothetical protein